MSSATRPTSPPVETVADVTTWLQGLRLPQYTPAFATNEITGAVLKTLTPTELRDDLGVSNLAHRRALLRAITLLRELDPRPEKGSLPEHGRILDHLSNVRTYHSWLRLGLQLLAFALVTLRLAPAFRSRAVVSAAAFYLAAVAALAFLYAVYRYRAVARMIERATPHAQTFRPDRVGVAAVLALVLLASVFSFVLVALPAPL